MQTVRVFQSACRLSRSPLVHNGQRLGSLRRWPQCPLERRFLASSRFARDPLTEASENDAKALDRVGRPAADEPLSEFKKQRLTDLAEDQSGSSPIFSESYPRLASSAERISNEEFIKRFEKAGRELTTQRITLTGRIRSKRVVGKGLVFIDIVNAFHRVQVMINAKKCLPELLRSDKFSMFRHLIQVGDHVSVTGCSTLTKAGELTLQAEELPELLAPTMEQLPEKLVDAQTKSQERHLDMLVNKETTDVLRMRSNIMRYLRDHFHSNKFIEMQTPILAENAGGAVARPFKTQATEFRDKELALRIAPELWLKRLVVGGIDKVFEIGPSFRNEGIDGTHNPEFTTCEFYSAYSNLADLITQTEEIMGGLATECQKLISSDLTSLPAINAERFKGPYKQVEMLPGLEAALGLRLPNLASENALPEMIAVLKLAGVELPGEAPRTLPKLLDRLAAIYLEPMSFEQPLFITNHPVCMSPLAKSFLCPRTYQLVSARAELFVGGRELANMYEEENNPEEQERKMTAHHALANRGKVVDELTVETASSSASNVDSPEVSPETTDSSASLSSMEESADEVDDEVPPIDKAYIRALEYGLPPTGGWGCGVERLVMLFSGSDRISDCLSFGTLRNVVGHATSDSKQK